MLTISYCGIIIFQSRSIWVLLWFIIFGILHSLTTQSEMQLLESGKLERKPLPCRLCEACVLWSCKWLDIQLFLHLQKRHKLFVSEAKWTKWIQSAHKGSVQPEIQWDRDRKWTGEEESLSVYTASQACMCPKLLYVTFFCLAKGDFFWIFPGSLTDFHLMLCHSGAKQRHRNIPLEQCHRSRSDSIVPSQQCWRVIYY